MKVFYDPLDEKDYISVRVEDVAYPYNPFNSKVSYGRVLRYDK